MLVQGYLAIILNLAHNHNKLDNIQTLKNPRKFAISDFYVHQQGIDQYSVNIASYIQFDHASGAMDIISATESSERYTVSYSKSNTITQFPSLF